MLMNEDDDEDSSVDFLWLRFTILWLTTTADAAAVDICGSGECTPLLNTNKGDDRRFFEDIETDR